MAMGESDFKHNKLAIGSHHYRAFVGPPDNYDLQAATQFNLLTTLGLRDHHHLLDVGCGSLRAGRLFIPYLQPAHYYGIEPEQWLIDEGIARELGQDAVRIKQPTFNNNREFDLGVFNRKFDYILAQSVFSHASQKQIRKCLNEVKKVLEPDGVFVATFSEGDDNYIGDEWVYPGVVAYTLNHMQTMAKEEHLLCEPLDWDHRKQKWVAFGHPESPQFSELSQMLTSGGIGGKNPVLENKLHKAEQAYERLRNHPYVRLGLGVSSFLKKLRPK
jgi:SAM-dependent methyltransferase